MSRVDCNSTKPDGRLFFRGLGFVGVSAWAYHTPPRMMPFRMVTSTAPDSEASGPVNILTRPYTTAACAAGVKMKTAGRGSSRYRHHG